MIIKAVLLKIFDVIHSFIHAIPVNFVFGWVPVPRDKVVKVQEPLPNCFKKQQQEVDS